MSQDLAKVIERGAASANGQVSMARSLIASSTSSTKGLVVACNEYEIKL
jgi:hypothetical protein